MGFSPSESSLGISLLEPFYSNWMLRFLTVSYSVDVISCAPAISGSGAVSILHFLCRGLDCRGMTVTPFFFFLALVSMVVILFKLSSPFIFDSFDCTFLYTLGAQILLLF